MPTTTPLTAMPPTAPPPINRKQFMDWLAAQSHDRTFRYCDSEGCLIASFFREACGINVSVGSQSYRCVTGRLPEAEDYADFPNWLSPTAVLAGCYEGGVQWLLACLRAQSFERDEL